MKCHAGVEFPSGKPCPKCGAKLGEVCWPGINADLANLKIAEQALRDIAEPVAALRRYAEENDRELDGHLAVQLAKNPDHLKSIAREALAKMAH